ncbi:MAG: hypothetical protein AAGI71_12920 [Bacteroidota bacterium]
MTTSSEHTQPSPLPASSQPTPSAGLRPYAAPHVRELPPLAELTADSGTWGSFGGS